MNYYLARDGQTYGPYPEESFPAMIAASQVVADDWVCPEGGDQWVAAGSISTLFPPTAPSPAPEPAPAPTPVVSTFQPHKLRISASPQGAPPAAAVQELPPRSAPVRRRRIGETLSSVWETTKTVAYVLLAIVILGSLLVGFLAAQKDRKEIAKLQSEPGWGTFHAANSQINSENSAAGYGNTTESSGLANEVTKFLTVAEKECFTLEGGYHGGSKLGRAIAIADAAAAGTGRFQTYVDQRSDRTVILIHVPEFHRYKNEARDAMRLLCWEFSAAVLQKHGRPRSTAALVVGVRGKSDFDCVFLGTPGTSTPEVTIGNVASHRLLVKRFAP